MAQRRVRRARLFVATLAVVGMVAAAAVPGLAAGSRSGTLKRSSALERSSQREIASNATAKEGDGGDAEGAAEIQEGANQWAEPRFGPPGALRHAVADARRLPVVGGPWSEVTTKPYNADDLNFADPVISNSGGGGPGPGWVTGRMTALALDGDTVFAGGADGGVWRSTDGGDHWTPLTDFLPTTSIGSLAVNPADHSVWVGTGESNTSSDSFMGMGVYRSTDDGNTWKHVGGKEIDHQMIGHLTFDGEGKLYAAASNGVWRRSAGGSLTKKWSLVLRPGTPGPYGFTFANDVQVKPHTNGKTVIANVAWRGGYTDYNGFYESTDGGNTWHMVQTKGINAAQIGRSSFAYASNGRLYAVVESIHKYLFNPETALMGVYFSPSGNVAGPWRLGAGSKELGNSPNNALGFGFGYSPGHPDLVRPADRRRPQPAQPRVPGPRGGLRVDERRAALGDGRALLELRPGLLRDRRAHELSADHAPRPARDRLRRRARLARQRRRDLQPGPARRLVVEPQRRPADAAVLLRRRRGAERRRARLLGRPPGQRRFVPAHEHVDDGLPVRRRRRRRDRRSEQRQPHGPGVRGPGHVPDHERRSLRRLDAPPGARSARRAARSPTRRTRATRARASSRRSRPT